MFDSPHRWCDQRCDRCPLRPTCVASTHPIAEPASEAHSIALDRAGLRAAATAHATATVGALHQAVELARIDARLAASIEADAFAIAARVGRIVGQPGERVIGHLLVLERLLTRVDAAILSFEALLCRDALARQRTRRWELGRALAPQMRAIRPCHRAALRELVAQRRAPSPFAIRPICM